MQWIRASERLPEGKERYFARIKTYLERESAVDCILTHAHNPEWYYAIGHELRLSIHAEKIVEWIDMDEQDEGWVPVVDGNFPFNRSIIIEHALGYDAVRLDKDGWYFWYAKELVPESIIINILKTAKRYLIGNKSQPPAATKD